MSALYDAALERTFISACMMEPSYALSCGIHPHEMGSTVHRDVYGALLAIAERGEARSGVHEAVDLSRLIAELGKRGLARHVDALADIITVALPSPSFAPRLRELAQGRAARDAALRLVATLESGRIEDGLAQLVSAAEDVKPPEASEMTSLSCRDLFEFGVMATMERSARRNAGKQVCLSTGVRALDAALGDAPKGEVILGGYEPGDLIIVGAGTNVGKSSYSLAACSEQARMGIRCGFISVEDGKQRMAFRQMSTVSGVYQSSLRSGQLSRQEWEALTRGSVDAASLPIRFEFEVGANLNSVASAIRRLVREHGCQCIYVDYAQAIAKRDGRTEMREHMMDVCATVKRAASIGVADPAVIVLLSQLKRAENDTRKPVKSDLAESTFLEQKGDTVVMLWKDEGGTLNGTMVKTKDGRTGYDWQMFRGRSGMLDVSGGETE